jgi:hypothetical protein
MTTPDELIVTCSCSHLHHAVRFSFRPVEPNDPESFEALVDVSLDYEKSWWGRLKTAIRYLRRDTCGYGDVSEILIGDQDLPKIRSWVERAERDAIARQKRDPRSERP